MQHKRGVDYSPMITPSWHDAGRVSAPQDVGVERPADVMEWMQVGGCLRAVPPSRVDRCGVAAAEARNQAAG